MKNYGLLESLHEVGEYILGQSKTPYIPFNESGDWEDYLPAYENQTTKLGSETSGCTAHGSLNQLETLLKFLYGNEPNFSERYTYNLVPIDPAKGANPHNTHECIRKHGVIDERLLPMTRSIDEYLDKDAITGSLMARGQNWLIKHDYRHEWLWDRRPENYTDILKEALQTSPIAVSVTAWNEQNGVYVSYGDQVNNHYCLLYKYDDDGYPWVFDSYDHSKKKLAKDHNIRRAKRIWVQRRTKPAMRTMIQLLQDVLKRLTMKPTLAEIAKQYLGVDASPKDIVSDEVGCSESVTTILKETLYPETPIIPGTWTFWMYLRDPKNGWVEIPDYEQNAIVISPTGSGKGIGHVGICTGNELIASNNSFGTLKGRFTENYTKTTWVAKYSGKQAMPVLYYRKVV